MNGARHGVCSARIWRLGRRGSLTHADSWPMPRPREWLEILERAETQGGREALRTCITWRRPFGGPSWTRRPRLLGQAFISS